MGEVKKMEKMKVVEANNPMAYGHEMIPQSDKGLSIVTTACFICGIVVGGGTVAIPFGLTTTGWIGLVFILLSALGNGYMAQILSECLCIMMEKDERYRMHLRDPYSAIINFALGNIWRIASIVCFHAFSVLTSTVYLLLASELSSELLNSFFPSLVNPNEFRVFLVIFAVLLIPLTFFGTPKEFWGIALVALLTTAISCILILTKLFMDSSSLNLKNVKSREVTWQTFFNGIGIIFFAFGGIPFFPALQTDMKKRSDFPKALSLGYLIIAFLYIPLSVSGFLLLGDNVKPNIVDNINKDIHKCSGCMALVYISQLLLGLHFVFAYNLILNPILQEVEEIFKIPRVFCWQRCAIRGSAVLTTLILAEAVPNFGIVVSMVGGTFLTVLTYVFPVLAYFKLKENMALHVKVILYELLFLSAICAGGTIYSSTLGILKIYSTNGSHIS